VVDIKVRYVLGYIFGAVVLAILVILIIEKYFM